MNRITLILVPLASWSSSSAQKQVDFMFPTYPVGHYEYDSIRFPYEIQSIDTTTWWDEVRANKLSYQYGGYGGYLMDAAVLLYPSASKIITSGHTDTVAFHKIGVTFDPAWEPLYKQRLVRGVPYRLDTITFPFSYIRLIDSTDNGGESTEVVDTLVVEFFKVNRLHQWTQAMPLDDYFTPDTSLNAIHNLYNLSTLKFKILLTGADANHTSFPDSFDFVHKYIVLTDSNLIHGGDTNHWTASPNIGAVAFIFKPMILINDYDTISCANCTQQVTKTNFAALKVVYDTSSAFSWSSLYYYDKPFGITRYKTPDFAGFNNYIGGSTFIHDFQLHTLFHTCTQSECTTVVSVPMNKIIGTIKVYPNPHKDYILLDIPSVIADENLDIKVVSLNGLMSEPELETIQRTKDRITYKITNIHKNDVQLIYIRTSSGVITKRMINLR